MEAARNASVHGETRMSEHGMASVAGDACWWAASMQAPDGNPSHASTVQCRVGRRASQALLRPLARRRFRVVGGYWE